MASFQVPRPPSLNSFHSTRIKSRPRVYPERKTVYLGKANWKDPERRQSIKDGTNVKMEWRIESAFSTLFCWIATPPAKIPLHDAWLELERLVNDRNLAFWEGESTSPGCSWDRSMHGRSIDDAQPTIIFNSSSKICRRNAKSIIADRRIVVDHRGIGLEFYAHGPQFFSGRSVLRLSENIELDQISSSKSSVINNQPISANMTSGRPLSFQSSAVASGLSITVGSRRCTLGGVIMVNGNLLGLTVAHVFEIGSESFRRNTKEQPATVFRSDNGGIGLLQHKRVFSNYEGTAQQNFDWAICSLDDTKMKIENLISLSSNENIPVREIVQFDPADAAVLVNTALTGVVDGYIVGDYSLVSLPESKQFQRMWIVIMNRNIEDGDCGSWVVDRVNHKLYGYIIAGKPNSKVAYILLARDIFRSISQQLEGAEVQLPSETALISRRLSSIKENIREDIGTSSSRTMTETTTSQSPYFYGSNFSSVPVGTALSAYSGRQKISNSSTGNWKPLFSRTGYITVYFSIFLSIFLLLIMLSKAVRESPPRFGLSVLDMGTVLFHGMLWQISHSEVRRMEPYYDLATTENTKVTSSLDHCFTLYGTLKAWSRGNGIIYYSTQSTIISTLVVPLLKLLFDSSDETSYKILSIMLTVLLFYNVYSSICLMRYRNRYSGLTANPAGVIGKMLLLVNPLWLRSPTQIPGCSSLLDAYRKMIPNSASKFVWHGYSWKHLEYSWKHLEYSYHLVLPPSDGSNDLSSGLNSSMSDMSATPQQLNFVESFLPEEAEIHYENMADQTQLTGVDFYRGYYRLCRGKILYKPLSHPDITATEGYQGNCSPMIPSHNCSSTFLALFFFLAWNLAVELFWKQWFFGYETPERPKYFLRVISIFVVKILWMVMEEDLREKEPFRVLSKGNALTSILFLDYTTTAPGVMIIKALRNGHYVLASAAAGSVLIDLSILCLFVNVELSLSFSGILFAIIVLIYWNKMDTHLPKGSYSLAQIFAFLYHSPLALYCLKMEGKDRKTMEKEMADSGTTWGMGWYVDHNGKRRYGIYQEEKLDEIYSDSAAA